MWPRLTVDLGNSACKLRLWNDADVPASRIDLALDDFLPDGVAAWLDANPGALGGAMCAVASERAESRLAGVLVARVPEFELRPRHGLEIECEDPETIGRDRLFAARGALERLRRSCVVVDAGTALTVDALRVAGDVGFFLGGAIAPGPALLARVLASGGARLPAIEPRVDAPALGLHTRAALEAGVTVGLRGAARELVAGIVREADLGPPDAVPVVLTGGARAFLTGGAPLAAEVVEDAELVHRGLLAALPVPRRS